MACPKNIKHLTIISCLFKNSQCQLVYEGLFKVHHKCYRAYPRIRCSYITISLIKIGSLEQKLSTGEDNFLKYFVFSEQH